MGSVHPPVTRTFLFFCFAAAGIVVTGCGILSPGPTLNANESGGSGAGGKVLTYVGGSLKHGGQMCFEDLPRATGSTECRGAVKNKSGKISDFSGTCKLKMPQEQPNAGDEISIVCSLNDGKSCFSGVDIETSTAIASSFESAESGSKWITKENDDGKGAVAFSDLKGTCREALGGGAPKPQPGTELPECTEEPAAPLRLAGEVPPPSECLGIAGPERMNCFLQKNAAEIYDYSVPGDVALIRAGGRSPNRCYVNFPNATSSSKHLFVYRDGSGFSGAIGLGTVGLGSSPLSLSYVFRRIYALDVPSSPVSSVSSDFLVGQSGTGPDENGYWVMGGFRVVRFVPKNWCADKYLRRAVDLNELQSVQLGVAPPPAPAPAPAPAPPPANGNNGQAPQQPCRPKVKE